MPELMDDISGGINDFNFGMGSNLTGVLIMIQLPLIFMFVAISGVLFMLLFGQKFVMIMPWEYMYKVTAILPYANGKMAVYQEKGALCNVGGLKRFKLKSQNVLMQKPDTTDVYSNNEVIVISLGPTKKFNGRRIIDYKNHKILFDVENPQVAQQFYADTIQENDPEIFLKKIDQLYLLWVLWFFSGLMVAVSNLLVIYPIFVKLLFMS